MGNNNKILIGLGLAVGSYLFIKQKADDFQERLKFRFARIGFDGFDVSTLSVNVVLGIEATNDNDKGVPIHDFDGGVYFNDTLLVPVKITQPVTIAANQKTMMRVTVPVGVAVIKKAFGAKWKDLFKGLPKGSKFVLAGTMRFKVLGTFKKLGINEVFYNT